jgi:hypothetical protein
VRLLRVQWDRNFGDSVDPVLFKSLPHRSLHWVASDITIQEKSD